MAIKYSLSEPRHYSSGGILEPTAKNFPALAHFFKCSGGSNPTVSLSDSINTSVVVSTLSGAQTANSDGTMTLGAAANTLTGTLTSPGTKNIVLLTVGVPSASGSNIRFGAVTGASDRGVTASSTTATASQAVGDGAAGVISTGTGVLAGNGSNLQAHGTIVQWGSTLTTLGIDNTTGAFTTTTTGSLVGHSGITTWTAGAVNFGAGSRPACIQLWYFTTTPSTDEVKQALSWTMGQIAVNPERKWAYPGWKGRT